MKALPLRRVCVLIACAAALVLVADAREVRTAFSEGVLWRVSYPGVRDSFVLGTIHVADARVMASAKPIAEALARSRVLATELMPAAVVDARVFELEELDAN